MFGVSPTALRWWREHGEPRTLAVLAAIALSLPPLTLLELISPQRAVRLALALAWVAGVLLAARLPRLLRQEQRRVLLLAGVLLASLAAALTFGGAVPEAAAQGGLSFKAAPRISQQGFVSVLERAGSPAAPQAAELYAIIVAYELDPAVALAFFQHESSFCKAGRCVDDNLRNWGMQRRAIKAERATGQVGGFTRYASWPDSMRDWCELILFRYVNSGLDTVEKAVPVYAPRADRNVPEAYINAIRRTVAAWSGRRFEPAVELHVYSGSLDQALVSETFLSAGIEYHPAWAFHTFMRSEAQAGRALGVPIDDSRIVTVGGKQFAVQVFALDTLYTPIADVEEETNWSDVRRLSDLLRAQPAPPAQPVPSPTTSAP